MVAAAALRINGSLLLPDDSQYLSQALLARARTAFPGANRANEPRACVILSLAVTPRSRSDAKYKARSNRTVGFVIEDPGNEKACGHPLHKVLTASAVAALVANPAPLLNDESSSGIIFFWISKSICRTISRHLWSA